MIGSISIVIKHEAAARGKLDLAQQIHVHGSCFTTEERTFPGVNGSFPHKKNKTTRKF